MNRVNQYRYVIEDILAMEGKIIDTCMSDLRIHSWMVPTLRAQRDGIFYGKNSSLFQLTGYEALLLQGFSEAYTNRVKDKVTERHLFM